MKNTLTFRIPPPGKRISIGDYALHAHQLGEGQPTVIFENGLGAFALHWAYIQSQIAQTTHTLSYDRAGWGWSDPSPHLRTPQQLSAELYLLLSELHLSPPYILVAHSFGGLISRYFAQQYPDVVKGIVLVDASHEMQLEKLKDYHKRHDMALKSFGVMSFLSRVAPFGRLIASQMFKVYRPHMSDETWRQFVYLAGLPRYHDTMRAEMSRFNDYFGARNIIPTYLGDLPLIVVTAAESMLHERPQGGLTAAEINQSHQQNQAELADMSSRGQHIVVPEAAHLSLLSNPAHAQYVIDAIRQLIHEA